MGTYNFIKFPGKIMSRRAIITKLVRSEDPEYRPNSSDLHSSLRTGNAYFTEDDISQN